MDEVDVVVLVVVTNAVDVVDVLVVVTTVVDVVDVVVLVVEGALDTISETMQTEFGCVGIPNSIP